MSVTFNENYNHTIIVEDVESDEEKNDTFKDVDLEKNQNQILPRNPQYQEKIQPPTREKQPQRKNKMSYDDILESMNMRVVDGKLEMIRAASKDTNRAAHVPYQNSPQQPSYIHNKYFKNYIEKNQNVEQVPLTPQERKLMFVKRRIEIENQRRRIRQIKSKKLLFTSDNVTISSEYQQNDLNKMFKFIGKNN